MRTVGSQTVGRIKPASAMRHQGGYPHPPAEGPRRPGLQEQVPPPSPDSGL